MFQVAKPYTGAYNDQARGWPVYNRTGGTTVKGGVALADFTASETASQTSSAADVDKTSYNVVQVTNALSYGGRVVVWKDAGVLDDAIGEAVWGEEILVDLNVDSTTDVAAGDKLKLVTTGDHMIKANPGERYHAIAMEAATANSEGSIKALLYSSGKVDNTVFQATYYQYAAAGTLATQVFFIAPYPCEVVAISEIHGTKGSSTPTLQVVKDTGTDAAGAGTDLLAGTGFDIGSTSTNATAYAGTLTSTAASLLLATGNRLSIEATGTLTALANVCVTVMLRRLNG